MSYLTQLDVWTETCRKLFKGESQQNQVHPLHSCIIDGVRHYIHAPELPRQDPSYFKALTNFAQKHGIELRPDRRRADANIQHERRRKLLPIVFLCLGACHQAAFADDTLSTQLNLFKENPQALETQSSQQAMVDEEISFNADQTIQIRMEEILSRHFSAQDSDPENMQSEIATLASYYALHPEAVALVESIADEDWDLKYAPHTFQTDIQGSRLTVDKITVYFDPRSGAKLKFYDKCSIKKPFCVASPADALLHELIHVQTVSKNTSEFIAEGGLVQHMYPSEHERKTILKENILYKSMSRRDKKPRPIRSEHTGRHVLVSCVTCIE